MITVFVSGQFNVLHPGHVRLFRFAKQCGDKLVVGVESDRLASGAALISESLRLEGVQSNSFVDEAFLSIDSESDVSKTIKYIFDNNKDDLSRLGSFCNLVDKLIQ